MSARKHAFTLGFAALAALIAAAPFFAYPFFVMEMMCVGLFACAFNLLIGYVGLLSFGHAMFFGMAAYVSAHAAKVWELDPALSILLGVATASALGLVAGALAIRSKGIYFAMITVALSQMAIFYCNQASFTHGEDGIQSVPQGRLLGLIDLSRPVTLYVMVALIFLAGFFFVHRVVNSPFGEVLKAIRENEPRAVSLGYRVARYKLTAFVLSASLAGLAGATKAIVVQNATLSDVSFELSGGVVLMTLLGGMGTMFGPAAGAVVVVSMQNYLASEGSWVTVIQGAVFVACVLLFRRGIVGEIGKAAGWEL